MIKEILKYLEDLKNSDLKRVKVTSSGDFFMPSEEIFNNKIESLELINSLRKSVTKYKIKTSEISTNKDSISLRNVKV
jgi:hypothetical protein